MLATLGKGVRYLVGVSTPPVRRLLVDRAVRAGLEPATLVHPTVVVGRDVEIAPGCLVWPGVIITTNVRVGAHCHVNNGVTIGHDSGVGALSTLNPQAAISGDVTIGEGVLVGSTACVLQGWPLARVPWWGRARRPCATSRPGRPSSGSRRGRWHFGTSDDPARASRCSRRR